MKTAKSVALCAMVLQTMAMFSAASAQPPYQYTNTQLRTLLPAPVIDGHSAWIDLYWKAWELARDHIYRGTTANGFVEYWMDEAWGGNIFQWDSALMMMFGRYAAHCWPSIVTLENFYRKQQASGYICREIVESNGSDFVYGGPANTINPPLYSWAEWNHFLFTADSSRFSKLVRSDKDGSQKTVLQRNIDFFNWVDQVAAPSASNPQGRKTSIGLYWNTGLGSGMDNTPRQGDNWIDMSAQMAMMAYYISKMATVAGQPAVAETFMGKYNSIRNLVNQKMWDAQNNFYFDCQNSGAFSRCYTVASFWPLLADIADASQAKSCVNYVVDPNHFWRRCPLPTLSKSDPSYASGGDYWKGSVWLPTEYMCVKGLERRGYDSLATRIGELLLTHMHGVFVNTGTIWENYSAENLSQGNPSIRDFVGWSGVGPISILIENIIGITPNAVENRVDWKINRIERHGLRNLHFGKNGSTVMSLTCAARTSLDQPPVLTIESNASFTLAVSFAGGRAERVVTAGTTTWTVEPASGAVTGMRQTCRRGNVNGLLQPSPVPARLVGDANPRALAIYSLKGAFITSISGADVLTIRRLPRAVYYGEARPRDAL